MFEGSAAAVEFQLEAARELVGGKRAGDEVWDEVRARPRGSASTIDDPVLRALHERIRAAASPRRDRARAHRRVHALRLLPADVPDVRAARPDGGRLPARPDLAHEGARRRDDDGQLRRRRAHRPLPRLHGVRDRVPVGRSLRPADRADARGRRGAVRAAGRRLAAAHARLLGLPAPAAAAGCAGGRPSGRDAVAEVAAGAGRAGAALALARAAARGHARPRASGGAGSAC